MSIKEAVISTLSGYEIGEILSKVEIVNAVSEKFGINKSNIIPSDCCYNRLNKGINFETSLHLFKYLSENGKVKTIH